MSFAIVADPGGYAPDADFLKRIESGKQRQGNHPDMREDLFHLDRFVTAQQSVYHRVCEELRQGEKTSHWMWFIFPQIAGLGSSATAQRFAVTSIEEARAYLRHPLLGKRLLECTELVIEASSKSKGRTVEEIFGYPDDLKFKSSMTLFAKAAEKPEEQAIFLKALAIFFQGELDSQTIARL